MKLAFLVDNIGVGGGALFIFKLAEHLGKKGILSYLFLNDNKSFSILYPNGIRNGDIYSFPVISKRIRGNGTLNYLMYKIYDRIFLYPKIKKINPDVIIGVHIEETIRAQRLSKKLGKMFFGFAFETPLWMKERYGDTYKLHGRHKRSWPEYKKALKQTNCIVAISNLTRKKIIEWISHPKKVIVIYPGINMESIDKIPEQTKLNQILYIGRISPGKNIHEILLALSSLSKKIEIPQLKIVGKGSYPYVDQVKKMAIDLSLPCEFLGVISEFEAYLHIKQSLFMVFPTSFEGFGMPPGEALYCKIPCIATNLPVLREIYEEKLEYFPEHDIEALEKKMEYLLLNNEYREKRGIEGYKYIKEKYTWEKSSSLFEKALKEIL